MIVGIPKEIKSSEYRVAITPSGVMELKAAGHQVLVQSGAGLGSGYTDESYVAAGAEIQAGAAAVFEKAELLLKVKEPLESEYAMIRENQVVFTYFHFASSLSLTKAMMQSKAVCIAYETVEKADRSLPLLIPMSEVAGRMSVQQGAKFLEKPQQGRGVLMGGIPGVAPAEVLILGAGVVGTQAARMAAGLGARVTLMDVSLPRLRQLAETLPPNVQTIYSSEYNIRQMLPHTDLVIGAVLIPGAKAPKLIRRDMLALMKPGSVLVDVAVDQGGCFETCRPTTHQDPVFMIDNIVHYCVANMPGAVPYTSTIGLTNATLPYVLHLARHGWQQACEQWSDLQKGLNLVHGKIVHAGVAQAFPELNNL
ncbi:MAG: alanine dehydrogenase [Cytophagaceae bacterium]|jgi:alanine dehydrogenase|nr:alanine dehydrogenase [Cytophagaceae bacterium]